MTQHQRLAPRPGPAGTHMNPFDLDVAKLVGAGMAMDPQGQATEIANLADVAPAWAPCSSLVPTWTPTAASLPPINFL